MVEQHAASTPDAAQCAAVIIEIARAGLVAMVGNVTSPATKGGGYTWTNGAVALRSPGSTLKPFIYAAAFEEGLLSPDTLVYDVPIDRAGWAPANFDGAYAGELPADEALRRSLNIPALLIAESVGIDRCLGAIESAGIRLPAAAQSRGGLAFVVGACEVTLFDLVNAYATLGRGGLRCSPRLFLDEPIAAVRVLDAGVSAVVNDELSCRRRTPRGLAAGEQPAWFMWKTGTSSGRRDAWAVGHNGRYAIGVWIGRFDGAGSPDFVGIDAAEPLLTRLFQASTFRAFSDPPAPQRLVSSRPMPPPRELQVGPRIHFPSEGARIVAIDGVGRLRPRVSAAGRTTCFLNGRLTEVSDSQPLSLPHGVYELRCVDVAGAAAAVRFSVVGSNQCSNGWQPQGPAIECPP
jgi:penicillin-binding protein 1C